MALGLDGLKTVLGEGARSNKYRITIAKLGGEDVAIAGKAASLPGRTIGQAEVYSQGRKLPLGGDVTYDTYDVTFYNNPTLDIRTKVEQWMTEIDDYHPNVSTEPSISGYGKEISVEQLDRTGTPAGGIYTLHNAWPTTVSSVDLASDSNDTVSEFTVTFAYSHYDHSGDGA